MRPTSNADNPLSTSFTKLQAETPSCLYLLATSPFQHLSIVSYRSFGVHFYLAYLTFDKGWIVVPDTKNKQPVAVPMTAPVKETLQKALRRRRILGPHVFIDEIGKPYSGHKVAVAFKRACVKAGVKDFRFHDLRHDFASKLVQGGSDLYRVQKLCGHKDQRMTQRYAHLNSENLKDAMAIMENSESATILLQKGNEKGATSL